MRKCFILVLALFFNLSLFGQTGPIAPTALPFLGITPDAVSGALGETGVASEPDVFSMYWNVGKLSYLPGSYGIGFSYVPWLAAIKSGISTSNVSGYRTLNQSSTLGISLSYFSIGKVGLSDEVGNSLGTYSPNEFALSVAYSRRLSENGSLGMTAKYLHSDLTSGTASLSAASGFAVDIGYYSSNELSTENTFSYGISINNIGPKISGPIAGTNQYLPTTLRIGTAFHLQEYLNSLNITLETSKLLVPTLPIYKKDAHGNNTTQILSGRDPNESVPSAIISSFYDAPGGFKEQIKQFILGAGLEYSFRDKLYLRAGYHYKNPYLGDRRYFTAGFGFKLDTFYSDFSYLIPTTPLSPYKDTFRLNLGFIIP